MSGSTKALSIGDVNGYLEHLINLLQTSGKSMAATVRTGLSLVAHFQSRDISGILNDLNQEEVNISQVVADIRKEFDI
jgi:hypothetical protein